MGGGGGDDGYEQRQQATEAKKQAARDALNAQFGVFDEASAPDRAKFTKTVQRTDPAGSGYDPTMIMGGAGGDVDGGYATPTYGTQDVFDEGAFNAAQSLYDQGRANASSRDALYQGVRDNAYTAGKRRLDEQQGDAARKLKFELFAHGTNGGSEDIDENARLGRTYKQGIMDLGAKADSAKAQFRGDDENTRLGLLQAIDSGTDQGSAISSAMNQMQSNADRAAAEANGTTLGDLFNTGELLYNKSQAAQGKAAGTDWWNTYTPTSKRATAAAATGRVSQV